VALFVTGRSSKQCRERWLSYFTPELARENWTAQENLVFVEKQGRLGNQSVKIKVMLPHRSLVAVKN
jgi:hypothetical protein